MICLTSTGSPAVEALGSGRLHGFRDTHALQDIPRVCTANYKPFEYWSKVCCTFHPSVQVRGLFGLCSVPSFLFSTPRLIVASNPHSNRSAKRASSPDDKGPLADASPMLSQKLTIPDIDHIPPDLAAGFADNHQCPSWPHGTLPSLHSSPSSCSNLPLSSRSCPLTHCASAPAAPR